MRPAALAFAFCAALVPVSAEALSCAPWSPLQAFETAQAAASGYSVVVGRFAFDANALPQANRGQRAAPVTSVAATLTGRALSRNGFDASWSKPVTLEVRCAASWCGSLVPGEPYLAFVEHEGGGLVVDLGPCPAVVFPNPTKALEREITRCLGSGECDPN